MTRTMPHFQQPTLRRGNSLILVTAILVLLVIIASAYISRVQGGRIGGAARQGMQKRIDIAQAVSQDLARDIAEALFARPVNGTATNANEPRLPIPHDAVRYAPNFNDLNNGIRYNFGQYSVIPVTNWPDPANGVDLNYPGGALGGPALTNLGVSEVNAIGEPGFGDARWLACFEPLRWTISPPFNTDGVLGTKDDYEVFSHYRHISNIARPNNGFRVCRDISDVLGAFGTSIGGGRVVTDLSIPIEQWLAVRPNDFNATTGLPAILNANDFVARADHWFRDYPTAYHDPAQMLPNFLDLDDLDGDGFKFNNAQGDLPQSEFIRGSARWNVGRVLCDTDNDGFTDSYWFLAPDSIDRGTRTIVGVRIIDNLAMANINTGTRFEIKDSATLPKARTKGTTPADIAIVGELREISAANLANPAVDALLGNYDVGLFDYPGNWSRAPATNFFSGLSAAQSSSYWDRHAQGLGLASGINSHLNEAERLNWWRLIGAAGPLTADIAAPAYAPYGLDTELELRLYAGNNNPWSYNRLEKATQSSPNAPGANNFGWYLLRGNQEREESSEFQDQLDNRGLVGDMRHRITTYSAVRNDTMPPWLWPSNWTTNARLRMKLDLRQPSNDFNRDNLINSDDSLYLYETIRRALLDDVTKETYMGDGSADANIFGRANRLAGGLAANIMTFRDKDVYTDVADSIVLQADTDLPTNAVGEIRAYGLERQPFLVEAMVGHVYFGNKTAAAAHPSSANGPILAGDSIVCPDSPESTFVVVQIANPFDKPLVLNDPRAHFELQAFGQTFDLATLTGGITPTAASIPTSSYASPRTLTIVAMDDQLDGQPFEVPWKQLLGLDDTSIVYVNLKTHGAPWSTARTQYDGGFHAPGMIPDRDDGIQIVLVSSGGSQVIVDRFNDPATIRFSRKNGSSVDATRGFAFAVGQLSSHKPDGDCTVEPLAGVGWPGVYTLGATDTYWVQWSHVTRAWGTSNAKDKESPRYVFANRAIKSSDALGDTFHYDPVNGGIVGIDTTDPVAWPIAFNNGDYTNSGFPDKGFIGDQGGANLDFPFQMMQKDADFEQVGELLDVFAHGHLVLFGHGTGYERTLETFSEYMQEDLVPGAPEANLRVGRLDPFRPDSVITGDPVSLTATPLPPALPAAMRVLDEFVCDGQGVDSAATADDAFRLANGFTGKPVHGMINPNTAPVEVLRALPEMTRLLHSGDIPPPSPAVFLTDMPRCAFPEAMLQAREKFNGSINLAGPPYRNGYPNGPDYRDREAALTNLRGGYGFESTGELLMLNRSANAPMVDFLNTNIRAEAWRSDFAAKQPFPKDTSGNALFSAYLSTDVIQPTTPDGLEGDKVAADAEEANLLFAGMSNLITTRSDTFTVYFRVRSFRQNPTTGVWDATDPEQIVDDSRYVMLVDRSDVNSPADQPRILYLEKLPN